MKRRFWVEEEDSVLAPGLSSFLLQPISSSRTWSTLVALYPPRKETEITGGKDEPKGPAGRSLVSFL